MGGDLNLSDSVPRLDSPVANAQSGFKSPTKVISWLSPTSQNIFTRRTILWPYHNLCANFFRGQRMIRTLRVHGSSKLTRTLRFSANANEFRQHLAKPRRSPHQKISLLVSDLRAGFSF